jgi:heptosyltransferase-1
MRVLLIKTSSMGDLFHTFPALTDAARAIPGITFDWMVEESFADIPTWHPAVKNVIPVAMRRWRKQLFAKKTRDEWRQLSHRLHDEKYDLILDAQGLVKSALLGFFAKGTRAGLDFKSARESFASFGYQKKHTVNFSQHAVVRMRQLFSAALGYPLPSTSPTFGLNTERFAAVDAKQPYVLFLFGTTWASKQWPEDYWRLLAAQLRAQGLTVKACGNTLAEMAAAERIAVDNPAVEVMSRLSIPEMARWIAHARGVVSVDTGFGHLAAALNVPTVSIYGSTNPAFTGAIGDQSIQLAADFPCSPCLRRECNYRQPSAVKPACYETIPPARVMDALLRLLSA